MRLLVIDPDELERLRLARGLERRGFEVTDSSEIAVGLVFLLQREPLAVLLPEEIPPLDATQVVPLLRRLTDAPVIVIGSGDDDDEIQALEEGADIYMRRPLSIRLLVARLNALHPRTKSKDKGTEPVYVDFNDSPATRQKVVGV